MRCITSYSNIIFDIVILFRYVEDEDVELIVNYSNGTVTECSVDGGTPCIGKLSVQFSCKIMICRLAILNKRHLVFALSFYRRLSLKIFRKSIS